MACGSCGQKYQRPTGLIRPVRRVPIYRRNKVPKQPSMPVQDQSNPSSDPANPVKQGETIDETPDLLDATGQPKSWVTNGSGKAFTKPIRKPLTAVYPNAVEPE